MTNRYCCKKCEKCFMREEDSANINEQHHCGEFFHIDWHYDTEGGSVEGEVK